MATDLARYLVDQIATDGKEGTSIERLHMLVDEYESIENSNNDGKQIKFDASARTYAFSLAIQHPNIHAGFLTKEQNLPSDSNKSSSKSKPKSKKGLEEAEDENDDENNDKSNVKSENVNNFITEDIEAREIGLHSLQRKYGDDLRLFANQKAISRALVGNAPDLAYAPELVLSYLLRKRGQGAIFPDIMKDLKLTNSNVFLQTKTLEERGLIVRLRAKFRGANSHNHLVASCFAHISPIVHSHEMIRETLKDDEGAEEEEEEPEQENGQTNDEIDNPIRVKEEYEDAENITLHQLTQEDMKNAPQEEEDEDDDENFAGREEEEDENKSSNAVNEITNHGGTSAYPVLKNEGAIIALLSSRKRLRTRILRLLTESPRGILIRLGLSIRLGLPPGRSDGFRVVNRLLADMFVENLVEFHIYSAHQDGHIDRVKCLKITDEGIEFYKNEKSTKHEMNVRSLRKQLQFQKELIGKSAIQAEVPFERQLMERVAQSGPKGTTIEDLTRIFGGSDNRRRDIDRLLNNGKGFSLLPQYADTILLSALDQAGRKRLNIHRTYQWLTIPAMGKTKLSPLDPTILRSPIEMRCEIRLDVSDIPIGDDSTTIINYKKRGRGPGKKWAIQAMNPTSSPKKKKSRGRPRKDHSLRALNMAAKYRAKRGLDDSDIIEQLNEIAEKKGPARKRGRPRKIARVESDEEGNIDERQEETIAGQEESVTGQEESVMEEESNMEEGVNGEQIEEESVKENGNAIPGPSKHPEISTLNDNTTKESEANTTNEQNLTQPENISQEPEIAIFRGSNPNKSARFNMTMQNRYLKVLEFFRLRRLIDMSRFDRDYHAWIDGLGLSEAKKKQYTMDIKVRKRFLDSMLETEKIVKSFFSLPSKRSKKQTIFHIPGVTLQEIQEYQERIRDNKDLQEKPPARNFQTVQYVLDKETVLNEEDLEMPHAGAFHPINPINLGAHDLHELLYNPKYRRQYLEHDAIRSRYSKRIRSLIKRVILVHEYACHVLNNQSTEKSHFVKAENVIDLSWWATEPPFAHYIGLAFPPIDDKFLAACQDKSLLGLPMSQIDREIRNILRVDERLPGGGEGCRETITNLMKYLIFFNLATPVRFEGEMCLPTEWTKDHMLYYFVPQTQQLVWTSDGDIVPGDKLYDFVKRGPWEFWNNLETSIPRRLELNQNDSVETSQNLDEREKFVKSLRKAMAWREITLHWKIQQTFLRQALALGFNASMVEDEKMIEQLSFACVTRRSTIERQLRRHFNLTPLPLYVDRYYNESVNIDGRRKNTQSLVRSSRSIRFGASRSHLERPLTKRQIKLRQNRVKRQAQELRERKDEEFNTLLNEFFSNEGIEGEEREMYVKGLIRAQEAYGTGQSHFSLVDLNTLLNSIKDFHKTGRLENYNSFVRKTEAPKARGNIKKSKKKDLEWEKNKGFRKSQFEWTKERDELLRDCGVILRVRDQYRQPNGIIRKNWVAIIDLFPMCTMGILHRRFERLRNAVGEEAYLTRLEVEWKEVWTKYRGTEMLPDEDPSSASAFDLRVHVDFLRKMIDKEKVLDVLQRGTGEPLPLDINIFQNIYDVDRPKHTHFVLDPTNVIARHFVGDGTSDLRSDRLNRAAFSIGMIESNTESWNDRKGEGWLFEDVKETEKALALKRIFLNTSNSTFDPIESQKLMEINQIEEEYIQDARQYLSSAHRIKSKVREGRQVQGDIDEWTSEWESFMSDQNFETIPIWKISERIKNDTLNGKTNSSNQIFRQMEDDETAAAILLCDQELAEIEIDMTRFHQFSLTRNFNAKKMTDVALEVPVRVTSKLKKNTTRESERQINILDLHKTLDNLMEGEPMLEKVLQWSQETDSAKMMKRWEKVCKEWLNSGTIASRNPIEAAELIRLLKAEGNDGITRAKLRSIWQEKEFSNELLAELIVEMMENNPTLIFEAGKDESRLVTSIFINHWTIKINDEQIIPHPWFNMYAKPVKRVWHDTCALILQAIITHPGITLAQLIEQLRVEGGLDRMDVCHVIMSANQSNLIQFVSIFDPKLIGKKVIWLANEDTEIALTNPYCLL